MKYDQGNKTHNITGGRVFIDADGDTGVTIHAAKNVHVDAESKIILDGKSKAVLTAPDIVIDCGGIGKVSLHTGNTKVSKLTMDAKGLELSTAGGATKISMDATGITLQAGTNKIQITAAGITLMCGPSIVKLGPEGVSSTGATNSVKGTASLSLGAPSVNVSMA